MRLTCMDTVKLGLHTVAECDQMAARATYVIIIVVFGIAAILLSFYFLNER